MAAAGALGHDRAVEVDRAGRIPVEPDLSLPGYPEVFVVGDMMALDNLPGVAQVAIQGARYAARTITDRLDGRPPRPAFSYRDKGSMATISRFSAVMSVRMPNMPLPCAPTPRPTPMRYRSVALTFCSDKHRS